MFHASRRLRHKLSRILLGIVILCFPLSASTQAQIISQSGARVSNLSSSPEENFQRGNITLAIQQWSRDIRQNNNLVRALYNRSQAYIVLKQYELAVKDLAQLVAIQGDKTSAEIFLIQGVALAGLNKLPEAIESFNRAEKLQPSSLVYNNRALAYQQLGQLEQAMEDLKKSVQIAPTSIHRLNLANVQVKLKQFPQAIKEMDQVIAQESTFFPAYLTRGIARYNLGQYEAALRDFLFSLTILPNQPEAYYYAGLSLAKLKRTEDATQNLIRAADIYLQQNQPTLYHQVLEKMDELHLQ